MSEYFHNLCPDIGNGFLSKSGVITGEDQDRGGMNKCVFYVVTLRRCFRQGAIEVIVPLQYFPRDVSYLFLEFQ